MGGAADHERIVARMVTRCQGRAKTTTTRLIVSALAPLRLRFAMFTLGSSPWEVHPGKFTLGSSPWEVHPGKFTLGTPLCPHSAEPESGTNARQPADEPRGTGLTSGPEIVSEIIWRE